jgi:hypothetical protein
MNGGSAQLTHISMLRVNAGRSTIRDSDRRICVATKRPDFVFGFRSRRL